MLNQNIDFLPASYKQTRHRNQRKVLRRSALVVFLALIVAGTIGQRHSRTLLERRRNELKSNAERMIAQLGSPETLKQDIARFDAQANLLTYLRLRVPPTRLMSTITNSLPLHVTLTEFYMKFENVPVVAAPAGRQAPGQDAAAAAQAAKDKPPIERDLADLQKAASDMMLVVSINGIAPHDTAIAQYLAELQRTGIFSHVTLLYTDQYEIEDWKMRRFGIRLRVRAPSGRTGASDKNTTEPDSIANGLLPAHSGNASAEAKPTDGRQAATGRRS